MERLTAKRGRTIVYIGEGCEHPDVGLIAPELSTKQIRAITQRLWRYENCGLEPESIPDEDLLKDVTEALIEWRMYKRLGTVEELAALKGEATREESDADERSQEIVCPDCGMTWYVPEHGAELFKRCPHCRAVIDREAEDEKETH